MARYRYCKGGGRCGTSAEQRAQLRIRQVSDVGDNSSAVGERIGGDAESLEHSDV
ncbi:hypothetical protein Poly21_51040 [Allorhodopirellula heiligendammensis]|uniref:Uncharacterized protein n=1 Tax=Allorhodopirellula heiligendammensis TaxID=2714739 RepID=A0A5C6BD35_9BACT|nr:hypothetical protein Poly21_51040 [Allorhodopirellula heiligendammensis]